MTPQEIAIFICQLQEENKTNSIWEKQANEMLIDFYQRELQRRLNKQESKKTKK